jgi:hypothetical protein
MNLKKGFKMELKFNKSIKTDPKTWPTPHSQIRVLHDFTTGFGFSSIELLEARVQESECDDGSPNIEIDFGSLAPKMFTVDDEFLWISSDEFIIASCSELGIEYNQDEWKCL